MRDRLQRIYHNMKTRCYNPNYDKYQYYGGKGVTICDEWKTSYEAFEAWALSHGYTDKMTLERKDVNGNYYPENCCWVSWKDQANNRTSNHYITYKGKTKTLMQWCDYYGLDYARVSQRIYNGWPVKKAFFEPIHETHNERLITYKGQTKRLYEWAKEKNLSYTVLYNRLARNWSVERALETPA